MNTALHTAPLNKKNGCYICIECKRNVAIRGAVGYAGSAVCSRCVTGTRDLSTEEGRLARQELLARMRTNRARWAALNPELIKQKYIKNREKVKRRTTELKDIKRAIPTFRILFSAREAVKRAKLAGMNFSPELPKVLSDNPPTHCECCNVELDYSIRSKEKRLRVPSLDRIDNKLGYTVGNVAIICFRCNLLKKDASVDDLQRLIVYMKRHGQVAKETAL